VINLELDMDDAVILRHTLSDYTRDHPGFFTDKIILKIREISSQLDKEIGREFEEVNS
tara:strand:- start:8081 stop:8254 length:174 start_codon:yes stop_codon:yes gene_type:complete